MTRPRAILGIALALATFTNLCHAEDKQPPQNWQAGLHRTDLTRGDLDVAGREVIQVRVDFDPGVTSPKHAHPGVEVAHVLAGTFEYQLDGRPTVILKAGDSLLIPAGIAHVAKNVGATKGSELATYIVKKDLPLVVLEK
ncbi:cupin domain-containing protein [Pseudomonas sp. ADAK18]|uniref:cupin domain-containing protein n=1 Tax=Pseudomonas sp. ADAK18 TaxID=2730848 RepID=UPI001462E844|nr:cupin domain-containing protein [Pseudomonas sp. ADAK18]QJI28871.1 cupin domain-containing protein [Pseudomonas sp. ADAK18]